MNLWPWGRKEERSSATNWLTFSDLLTPPTAAGVAVTQGNAIEHPAVYRCVDLNAQTIASMPVDCMAKRENGRREEYAKPIWMRDSDGYDFADVVAQGQASCELYDSAFLMKSVDDRGHLIGLDVLNPVTVTKRLAKIGEKGRYAYEVELETGKLLMADTEIVHIKAGLPIPGELRGVSPIHAGREVIGTGMAARQMGARFFGSGAILSGIIEVPDKPAPEAIERLRDAFTKKHGGVSKSHAIGILSGGAKWQQISVKPSDAQALETQSYTDAQIAAMFGVPFEYVSPGGMEGAKGYVSGLYQRQMLWYQTGLMPRITRWERALSQLLPRPAYVKFNVNAWLRMDPEQRVAFYQAGQQGQWLTVNEIRAWEDLNPLPDGDKPLKSVQWTGNEPDPPPDGETDTDDEAADERPF